MSLIGKKNKVIILGLGKSIYDWVNYRWAGSPLDEEVWTINAGAVCYQHHLVFDMHTEGYIAALDRDTQERVLWRRAWLKSHDRPIVMPKALPEFPTSLTYPLREVIEKTGSVYFSTGLAYMLGLAFACEVNELLLFGTDFSYDRNTNTHDEQGRACAEYWIGRLVERGTKVGHSPNSHFMDMHKRSRGKIYGYDEPVQFDHPVEGGRGKFVGPDYTQ